MNDSQNEKEKNEKQIAFIICANDPLRLNECLMYLSFLKIPEGFTTDVITISDAPGMCAAYNAAMKERYAKFKVYLHQDVFIIDWDFLLKLLQIFESDRHIGMVGAIGTPRLDYTGIMWDMPLVGNLRNLKVYHRDFGFHENEIIDVDCIDGLLMATQVDVSWREDIFTSFDFYDISQSFEFKKRGYRVVVQDVADDGIVHDDGVVNVLNYERWRSIFVEQYKEFLMPVPYASSHGYNSSLEEFQNLYKRRDEYQKIFDDLTSFADSALASHDMKELYIFAKIVDSQMNICKYSNTVMSLYNVFLIVIKEMEAGEQVNFINDVHSVGEALEKFQKCRHMVMRQRFAVPGSYLKEAGEYLDRETSAVARKNIENVVDLRLELKQIIVS